MTTNFSGPVESAGGFTVDGVTVIDGNGKIIESASIELADGDTFLDTNSNEVMEFTIVASAVNHIGIVNAATGNNPILRAEGEANTGLIIDNSESEEIVILNSIATSVNEFTISSAATGNGPQLEATGGDTNINIELIPKGTGNVEVQGGQGFVSNVTNGFVPFVVSSAPTTTTDTAAVLLTSYFTNLVTTGAAVPTLADGTIVGMMKKIQFITDAGDAVLTPTTLNGGTTITFADIGDTAELLWDGSGWQVLALYNNADGTTAPVLA